MSTEEILHCNSSKSFENSSTEAETPSVKQLEDILYSDQSSCRHVDEVWPNIYLGDMYMAHDRYGLWKMGITHVLNAAHGKMCCKGSQDFYGTTIDYHGVPANDLPDFDLSQYFYSSADYIHKAINSPGAKIFVHCAVGVSRSASLVLAYLMLYHHFSLVDAIKKVKENRAIQRMGITHVLNATHSKQGSLGHQSFYGKKIQYYGIAAEDSLEFDLLQGCSSVYTHYGIAAEDSPEFDLLQGCISVYTQSTEEKDEAQSRRMPVTNNTVSSAIKSQSEYITPSLQDLQHLLWTRRGASGHVDQVWPRIYLGDKWAAKDKRSLQSLQITHILNAADGKYNVCTGARYYRDMNIIYHGVEAFDTTAFDISPFFYSAAKFIREALEKPGGNVLVHCAMGLSRSATLVLAFLMIYENKTLVDALKAVSEHRNISPNMGFLGQLQKLDMRLNDERKLRRECN